MKSHDYYQDTKFCGSCTAYVRYLRAVERCYCVRCGAEVRLFSRADADRFRRHLGRERLGWNQGGEPGPELDSEGGGDRVTA